MSNSKKIQSGRWSASYNAKKGEVTVLRILNNTKMLAVIFGDHTAKYIFATQRNLKGAEVDDILKSCLQHSKEEFSKSL